MSREAEVAYEVCDGVAVLATTGQTGPTKPSNTPHGATAGGRNHAPHRVFRVTREQVYP